MSETLSAGERARMREWHAPDLEPGGVQPWCICGFRWPCPIERSLATIEALQAEVTTLRTALEKAETNLRRYCRHQWNPRNPAFAVCDWCGEYQSLGGTTWT